MKKIAIIEEIHKDGIDLIEKNSNYKFEIITDVSENNLIKKLPEFDACTLRVTKLDEKILKHCPNLKAISRHGVGIDNVDLNYIKNNNISLLITATAFFWSLFNLTRSGENKVSSFSIIEKFIIFLFIKNNFKTSPLGDNV